jgi:hypothetical protein
LLADGRIHRNNGPAIEHADGTLEWRIHNKRHREDGPAIIYPSGTEQWYFRGEQIEVDSQEEFEKVIALTQIQEAIDE